MCDEYVDAITAYRKAWQGLAAEATDKKYFKNLKPTSLGWKVADRAELMQRLDSIRDACEQIHFGWVNERWLVTAFVRDPKALPWGLRVIKLMERRPGSTDATGLDHLDFYAPHAKAKLEKELSLKWNEEKNGHHCKWISVWFSGGEAKLRGDTVLQVCANEMLEYEEMLLS